MSAEDKDKIEEMLTMVIPLFNEEANIRPLLDLLTEIKSRLSPVVLKIILIDDGSTDNTFAVAKQAAINDADIALLKLSQNYGSHTAIMVGLHEVTSNCAMFIAGDLQDPPSVTLEMVEAWRRGYQIVWAAHLTVEGKSKGDSFFSSLYWRLANWTLPNKFPPGGVDFALMDQAVIEKLKSQGHRQGPIFQQIAATGLTSQVIRYTKKARLHGKSGWTLKKKLHLVLQTITYGLRERFNCHTTHKNAKSIVSGKFPMTEKSEHTHGKTG